MQIVIDIPEEEYIRICDEPCTELGLAVRNGTPLPDIAEDMRTLDRSMECVLESDHRSFSNRETENGWLFDHIIEWRKYIRPYIEEEG